MAHPCTELLGLSLQVLDIISHLIVKHRSGDIWVCYFVVCKLPWENLFSPRFLWAVSRKEQKSTRGEKRQIANMSKRGALRQGKDTPIPGRQAPSVQVLSNEWELNQKLWRSWQWVDRLINLIEKPDFLLIFHHTLFSTLNWKWRALGRAMQEAFPVPRSTKIRTLIRGNSDSFLSKHRISLTSRLPVKLMRYHVTHSRLILRLKPGVREDSPCGRGHREGWAISSALALAASGACSWPPVTLWTESCVQEFGRPSLFLIFQCPDISSEPLSCHLETKDLHSQISAAISGSPSSWANNIPTTNSKLMI